MFSCGFISLHFFIHQVLLEHLLCVRPSASMGTRTVKRPRAQSCSQGGYLSAGETDDSTEEHYETVYVIMMRATEGSEGGSGSKGL